MKGFFKLLLAGLFLMALLFVAEPQITSIDEDVGTYISQDIQDCNATFENTEIGTRLNYSEVGIVPGLSKYSVSIDVNVYATHETLLGSNNLIDRLNFDYTYNEGKPDTESCTSTYKTKKKTLNYNSHYRLARSRYVNKNEYVG